MSSIMSTAHDAVTENPAEASLAEIRRWQRVMIMNGALVSFFGLLAGFLLMFHVLGAIHVWPLFTIEATIPGSHSAWRAAHVGPLLNGVLCIAIALCYPLVALTPRMLRAVSIGMVYTVWANANFYACSVFGKAHALTGSGTPKLPEANLFDAVGLMPAMVATIVTPLCMLAMVQAALRRHRET